MFRVFWVFHILHTSERTGSIWFYPSLILGTDRFYASDGAILVKGSVPDIFGGESFGFGGLVGRLAVGYSFGSKLRIIPEFGAFLGSFTGGDRPWGFFTLFFDFDFLTCGCSFFDNLFDGGRKRG